ncbi:MAG: hypothetical protein AAGG51_28235 [Cyanobacteria bacterium P01_G01_bin.54]
MKLQQLKAQTQETWDKVIQLNSAIALPNSFKAEIRHFGDLRRKATWELAYCHFHARYICDVCLDAFTVVLGLSITEEDWRYPYRSTLPKEAQKALMMGDAVANYDLQETQVKGDQAQRNAQIVDAAKESGKKVRRGLPW